MASKGPGFRWAPEKFRRKLDRHLGRNLDIAAITLATAISGSFGNSGVTGGKSGATRKERASNRSKPGGPPNVDSGQLERNIGFEKPVGRPLVRKVGTGIGGKESVNYAFWLEVGTRFMAARPYLRPMLARMRSRLRRIINRPLR